MSSATPFTRNNQLIDLLIDDTNASSRPGVDAHSEGTIPSYPHIPLRNVDLVKAFLTGELWASDLEAMSRHLWVMTTQSSSNINTLHRQKIKGREIIVTQDPRLHLVWSHDRIFVKPLPLYLLSHKFWEIFLPLSSSKPGDQSASMRKAALGFLRTYRHLIRYEIDFFIAQRTELRLIPPEFNWNQFAKFMTDLEGITDRDVSGRYHYGEIRLSRLNFYAPFYLRKFYYEQIHGQYSDIFSRLFGPLLFVFAMVSTLLNSMQVGLAVDQVSPQQWQFFWLISRWFSVISLFGTAGISAAVMSFWVWLFVDEWVYAVKCLRNRKKKQGLSV